MHPFNLTREGALKVENGESKPSILYSPDKATEAVVTDNLGNVTNKVLNGTIIGNHSDFATAQDAIDFADANGYMAVFFPAGTYDNIVITTQGMSIIGDSTNLCQFTDSGGHCIDVQADDVSLINLKVIGSNGGGNNYDGIHCTNNRITVLNVKISSSDRYGIYSTGNDGKFTDIWFNVATIDSTNFIFDTGSNRNELGLVTHSGTTFSYTDNGTSNRFARTDLWTPNGATKVVTVNSSGDLTPSGTPDLGSATDKFNSIYLDGDVFVGDDLSGLGRVNDEWLTGWQYFNPFSGWLWASGGAVFDGAPSVVNSSAYRGLTYLTNNNLTEQHFAYQSVTLSGTANLTVILGKARDSTVGIRMDDGTDDDNYFQMEINDSAIYPGMSSLVVSHREGGAISSTTYEPFWPSFITLKILFTGSVALAYSTIGLPLQRFLMSATGLTWTLSRVGITFQQKAVASSTDRAGILYRYRLQGVV